MQISYLYASDFPFKSFCKIAQHTETIRKKCLRKAYSLSIRVQTTINHNFTFLCFFTIISTSKKMFTFRARTEQGIARHIHMTRTAWLGFLIGSFGACRMLRTNACKLSWTLLSPARALSLCGPGRKESSGTGLIPGKNKSKCGLSWSYRQWVRFITLFPNETHLKDVKSFGISSNSF